MTASPDDPTSLPRRTKRSSAIAEAATAKKARPEDWSGGPAGTAGARRAAAVPGEPPANSTDSSTDSVYADGFAAGLAFGPGAGAAPEPAVPDARPRWRRKVLLSGAVVACAVLIGGSFVMWAAGDDGRGASAASRTVPAAGLGGGSDRNTAAAFESPSTSPSPSPSKSPSTSPSPSPSASSSPPPSTKSTAAAAGSGATKETTTAPSLANGVSIRGKGSGRCIDLTEPNPEESTPLQLWDCAGTAGQTWTFMSDGTIRTLGKCMDVIARSQDDGAGVQLTVCNDSVAQQFRVSAEDELINTQTGKCVDVKDAQTANGSPLQMLSCQGTSNEAWSFG